MKIAKETWIIMAIGLTDLATTILFIQYHGAEEANPLFKHYWEMGLAVFIGAKVALLVGPLSLLEWARTRRPVFVSWALRSAIVAYLAMYGIGCFRLNQPVNGDFTYAEMNASADGLSKSHYRRPRLTGAVAGRHPATHRKLTVSEMASAY